MIDFAEKEKTCQSEEVNCSVSFLFLFFAVFLMMVVFFYLLWSCFTVSIRILQIWELKSSYYFNDHKQPSTGIFYCILLHFITFLLFRLKETCLFTIWGVFFMRYIFSLAVCKACLPWDVYKKAIMLRAVPIVQA